MINYTKAENLDATLKQIVDATLEAGAEQDHIAAAVRAAAEEATQFAMMAVGQQYLETFQLAQKGEHEPVIRIKKTKSSTNKLLDAVIEKLSLKNDAALSKALDIPPTIISKLRHHKLTIGPAMLLRMHGATGWSIQTLKDMLTAPADSTEQPQ